MADVAKCPFCLEWVRTASNLEPIRVQCPICAAQFSSVELLEMQPPELLLLPDLPDPESEGESDKAAVAGDSTVRADALVVLPPEQAGEGLEPSPSPLQDAPEILDPQPIGGGRIPSPFVTPSSAGSASVSRRWRARQRRRNPATELLKIVLGGIAGILIAQLILWWLPGDLRRDPLGLAPRLPDWLQWMRPSSWDEPMVDTRERRSPAGSPADRPDPFADEIPMSPLPPDPFQPTDEGAMPAPDQVSPASAWIAEDRVATSNIESLIHRADAPVYTGPELRQALAAVRTTLESFQNSPPANREARRDQQRLLYQQLCDVAQIVSFLDGDDAEIGPLMQAVEATLGRFTADPQLRRLVAEAAESWLRFPTRTSDGIALIGRVAEIRPRDATFETVLQLQSNTASDVRVFSPADPNQDAREPYAVGDDLILLGSILPGTPTVEQAAETRSSIWSGFHSVCTPP